MNHDVVRGMLQKHLAESNEYEAHEVLSLIHGSELWREQVRFLIFSLFLFFKWMSTRLTVPAAKYC